MLKDPITCNYYEKQNLSLFLVRREGTGSCRVLQFSFNEAVSLVVECDTQKEIDFFWDKLTEGGEESQCGWLKDRFGFSWQIVPAILSSLMTDPEKSERVIKAFLKMKKFEIEKLINA